VLYAISSRRLQGCCLDAEKSNDASSRRGVISNIAVDVVVALDGVAVAVETSRECALGSVNIINANTVVSSDIQLFYVTFCAMLL